MKIDLFRDLVKRHKSLYKIISLLYNLRWRIRKFFKHRILDRDILMKHKNDFSYHEYSKESIASYYEPISVDGSIPEQIQFFINKTFHLPPSFYNVFDDVDLIGPEAVGVLNERDILVETAGGSLNILDRCSPRLFTSPQKIKIQKEYDCAAVFITPWISNTYKNYFHWFAECLFLIEAIDKYSYNTGVTPKIIISNNPRKFQINSLGYLGYNSEHISKWKYNRARVKRLVVPSLRRQRFGWVDIYYPDAIMWLRDRFSEVTYGSKNTYSNNIFISREKSEGRRMSNSDELQDFLEKYNFKSYCLEDIDFLDQVIMFSNARNIIAAHGAGLTNIIFSSNSNIIEIFGAPPIHYTEYYRISQHLGHNYGFVFCDYSYDNYKDNRSSHYKEHDLRINISDLEVLAEKLDLDHS